MKGIEQKLEKCKNAVELKDKELEDTKKIFNRAKHSYGSVSKENKKTKRVYKKYKITVQTIPTATATKRIFTGKGIFSKTTKRYKKVVSEEEIDSEGETSSIFIQRYGKIGFSNIINT